MGNNQPQILSSSFHKFNSGRNNNRTEALVNWVIFQHLHTRLLMKLKHKTEVFFLYLGKVGTALCAQRSWKKVFTSLWECTVKGGVNNFSHFLFLSLLLRCMCVRLYLWTWAAIINYEGCYRMPQWSFPLLIPAFTTWAFNFQFLEKSYKEREKITVLLDLHSWENGYTESVVQIIWITTALFFHWLVLLCF